jgi:hypothetical protein
VSQHFIDQLREAINEISKRGATRQNATHFAVQCRVLLEAENNKNRFPIANLFGDWTVHSELNRSGGGILEEINDFLGKLLRGEGAGPFGSEITKKFKLDELRAEYLEICEAHGINSTPLKDDKCWSDIRNELLEAVCERPLVAKNYDIKRLAGACTGHRFIVTAVRITKDKEILEKFGEPAQFAFIIELREIANLAAEPRKIISQIIT